MATVADIEPDALTVTPGRAETLTLTVHNDGDDVEAYHLSVVDDAEDDVAIEPEMLLVHAGETGTATATINITQRDAWRVGDMIVRFHVTPTVRPGDPVIVEAVATITSFSNVAAALSRTTLEGRRGGGADIEMANTGNTHTYADIAASSGELAVAIDHAHVALPALGSESVGLTVRAKSLLWRGDPVQHPFIVTVGPEGEPPISLQGTFTQLPVFPGWALKALIGAGALAVLGLVWLVVLAWGTIVPPAGSSPTGTVVAEPLAVPVELTVAEKGRAGDPAVATLTVDVEDPPDDALVAVAVAWPAELSLTDSTCEGWVGAEIDRELRGEPRSGDECLIDPSGSPAEVALTFSTPVGDPNVEPPEVAVPTPPATFEVTAAATRLLTIEDGEVTAIEPEAGMDPQQDAATIEVEPYPFWMDVEVVPPAHDDDGTREVRITVHRTLRGDGTDEEAQMGFELLLPQFAELSGQMGICDDHAEGGRVCIIDFPLRPNWDVDLAKWEVTATLEITDDAPNVGLVSARPVELTIDGDPVPEAQVPANIRGAEAQLVVADELFPVNVELAPAEATAGELVTATVEVTHSGFPPEVEAFRDGTWMLSLNLAWHESLTLNGQPGGCASFEGGVCTLPAPDAGAAAVIELSFTVAADVFDSGEVSASSAGLSYDPTTEADQLDGRQQPAVGWPAEWIGSDAATFFPF